MKKILIAVAVIVLVTACKKEKLPDVRNIPNAPMQHTVIPITDSTK